MLHDDLATGTAARLGDAALALLLALLVTLSGIGTHALWTPDEPRDAAIGLAMARSGDVVTPRLNGRPFLEKPPLYWWVEAGLDRACRIDGMPLGDWRRDAVSRLPSAIFGAMSLLVAFALGRRLGGRRGGFLALGVLASMVEFGEVSGRAIVDPAVVFAVALGHLGLVYWHGARSGEGGEHRRGALLVAISLPLSFLAKGIVGPGLVLGPGILYLAVTQQWRALLGAWPIAVLGTVSLAAGAAPYLLLLHREGGNDALYELLVKNVLGRFFSRMPESAVLGHIQPLWYYLEVGPATIAPWVAALPALLAAGALRRTFEGACEPRRLLLATFLFGLVLLSVPSTKRELYLTPLFPALAAVVAWWLATASPARPWDRPTLVLLLVVAALAPLLGVAALVGLQHAPGIMPHVPIAALKKLPLAPVAARVTMPLVEVAGALAVLWSGFLFVRLVRGARHGSLPGPGLVVVAWVVVGLVYQSGVKALIDPLKDMHPLMAAVAREIPGPGPVVVWDPNETIQGIIEFDLSRSTDCHWPGATDDPSGAFGALLRAGKVTRFLTDVKDLAKLDPAIRAGLRTVYSDEGEVASPHQIVEWVGSGEEHR